MKICKITFPDGAWIKAQIPDEVDRIDYVLANFGMFSEIAELPESDAAVKAAKSKKVQEFRVVAIERKNGVKHTGPIARGRSEACDAFREMLRPYMCEKYQRMNCDPFDFMREDQIIPV